MTVPYAIYGKTRRIWCCLFTIVWAATPASRQYAGQSHKSMRQVLVYADPKTNSRTLFFSSRPGTYTGNPFNPSRDLHSVNGRDVWRDVARFTSHGVIGNNLYLLPNKMMYVKDIQRTSFRAFRVSTRLPDISEIQASVVGLCHPSSSGPVAASEFREIADDYQRIIPIRRGTRCT